MAMTDPSTLTADMLVQMAKELETLRPQSPTFLLSSGYRARLATEFKVEHQNPLYLGAASYSTIPVRYMDIPRQQVFDWSRCRSPSRAKRRHARGIPQRVKITEHDVAYMIDERALRDLSYRQDRWCTKLLYGGE